MYCFLCKELIAEDEICETPKCRYIRRKIDIMGIDELYKLLVQYYYRKNIFNFIDIHKYQN
tara:strand:+ start:1100 stop:1282 length:183 start_codon:yes stop_codon:yes gene_type:complete